jgi:hypothetical protein
MQYMKAPVSVERRPAQGSFSRGAGTPLVMIPAVFLKALRPPELDAE